MAVTVDKSFAKGGRHPLLIKGTPGDRVQAAYIPVTFDSSYPTGGEAVDLTDLFKNVLAVFPTLGVSAGLSKNVMPYWDDTNAKVILYDINAGGELTNASDASDVVVHLLVLGQD